MEGLVVIDGVKVEERTRSPIFWVRRSLLVGHGVQGLGERRTL